MSMIGSRVLLLALFLSPLPAHPAMADSVLKVPFQYANGRNSLLLAARINEKPALLLLETGSAKTAICPEVLGPQRDAFAGEGVEREVELQVGNRKWEKRKVTVMNSSQASSVCQEKIDGILGVDFLREFSQVIINIKGQTLTFIEEDGAAAGHDLVLDQNAGRLSFGNLRKLELKDSGGHYTLNGTEINRIPGPLALETRDRSIRVRITFLETIKISTSLPVNRVHDAVIKRWAETIPLVEKILKDQDPIGSLKPVVYDLIEPKGQQGLELQEEVALLWSADPSDGAKIGNTNLLPPMPFPSQIVDVQYRGLKTSSERLFGKIVLQILYIRDHSKHFLLGGFVIVSKPGGEYEFYQTPMDLLRSVIIEPDDEQAAGGVR